MKSFRLKNNLEINFINEKNSKTSIVSFVVETGLAVENKYYINGINHMILELLFSGTDKYSSKRTLQIYLESIGAKVSTQVTFETFEIYIEVPSYNLAKVISVLSDIVQNSHFEQADIETAKKNVKENYFTDQGEGYNSGKNFIQRYFYFNDQNNADSFLTLESLMSITKSDLTQYISSQIQPSSTKLFVIGGINNEVQINDLIEQEWGQWTNKQLKYMDASTTRDDNFPINLPFVNYRQRGSFFAELNMGFLIDNKPLSRFYDDETGDLLPKKDIQQIIPDFLRDYARIVLLNQVIGVGIASKLWVKTVEEEMYFDSIESEFISLKNLQFLNIRGFAENNQFTFALESVLKTLESLKRSTISIHELSRNKEILKAKLTLMHDNKIFRAVWIVQNYLSTGIILDIDDFIETIMSIGANEIRSLSLDLFLANRMTLFVSGTSKERRIVDKLINKYLGSY